MDIAARDNRAETAWIFGTFVYDGRGSDGTVSFSLYVTVHHIILIPHVQLISARDSESSPSSEQWRRIIPIGLMWGNDPDLNQEAVLNGGSPKEHWVNPAADVLFQQLNPNRYWWGWNGRLNG